MHTQYRRGHEAHGRSKLQILPYLRNYRFLWKATRLFCRYSRLLHVSTLILTSRAVALEIRMGQTDIHTHILYIQTHKTTTLTLLRILRTPNTALQDAGCDTIVSRRDVPPLSSSLNAKDHQKQDGSTQKLLSSYNFANVCL